MNYFIISFLLSFMPFSGSSQTTQSLLLKFSQKKVRQTINPCEIYGQIYVEKDRRRATYLVYVEPENDYRAKLVVFKEVNAPNADQAGLWYFVEQRGFADYTVHFVEDRGIADFTIYYTDKLHRAGCK